MPNNLDLPVLCDSGSAVLGDEELSENIQHDIYRSPEVILEISWTYGVDIWNVGCMVIQPSNTEVIVLIAHLADLEPLRRRVAI